MHAAVGAEAYGLVGRCETTMINFSAHLALQHDLRSSGKLIIERRTERREHREALWDGWVPVGWSA